MSLGDFSVASNIAVAASLVVLWWRGLLHRYHCVALMLVTAMNASISYHMCWTHELAWCSGEWGTSGRAVALSRDLMAAFQALLVVSVPVNEWLLRPRLPEWSYMAYLFTMHTLTWWLVAVYNDDLAPTLVLGITHALAFGVAMWAEIARARPSVWWLARLSAGIACIGAGIGCRTYALQHEWDGAAPVQSDAFNSLHGSWHMLAGVGTALILTLVEPDTGARPAAYAKIATPAPAATIRATPKTTKA